MSDASENRLYQRAELIRLIRQIVREECGEVLDEHVSDYVHVEKPFKTVLQELQEEGEAE